MMVGSQASKMITNCHNNAITVAIHSRDDSNSKLLVKNVQDESNATAMGVSSQITVVEVKAKTIEEYQNDRRKRYSKVVFESDKVAENESKLRKMPERPNPNANSADFFN